MGKLRLKKIVKSTIDSTIKYVFYTEDNLIIEFSYINKNDGKDIICVPCNTLCNLACKFCFATDLIGKIVSRNLTWDEITDGIDYIYLDLKLKVEPKTLLISYMGMGDAVTNYKAVVDSMNYINNEYKVNTRFAFATALPKYNYEHFFNMVRLIDMLNLNVKLHISLHYTTDELRNEWMKASLDIKSTIAAADFYKIKTGNKVEIHYALIDGINDTEEDAIRLTDLIKDKGFNVKFLYYNEKENIPAKHSDFKQVEIFAEHFKKYNIEYEYYIPPGQDCGSSCGIFLMDEYIN